MAAAERVPCTSWEHRHQPFLLRDTSFTQQFVHIYQARLDAVAAACEKEAQELWPGVPTQRIVNLAGRCVVVGALFKNLSNRPDFLQQYQQEVEGDFDAAADNTVRAAADDTCALEDRSGRIALCGAAFDSRKMTTGLVVAVLGTPSKDSFVVEDWVFPPLAPQPERPLPPPGGGAKYVAIVGGMRFGAEPAAVQRLQADALGSFLTGGLGCGEVVGRIARLVVAGGVIAENTTTQLQERIRLEMDDHKAIDRAEAVRPVAEFDAWLARVAQSLPADVMPGKTDPTNPYLPYQPLHPCLLPQAFDAPAEVCPVTSPHSFRFEGVSAVGMPAESLQELLAYTTGAQACDCMELVVRSGMLAPTAPDTLYCYPFKQDDPLQLRETPHVLFAAGAPEFSTRVVEVGEAKTRVVAFPDFWGSPGVALVDFASPDLATTFIPLEVDFAGEKKAA